jgi:hypothetical protein
METFGNVWIGGSRPTRREKWIVTNLDGTLQYFGRGEWGPVGSRVAFFPTRGDATVCTIGRDDMHVRRIA